MSQEFKWNDELVMEFVNFHLTKKGIHWTSEDIKKFKKIKQPKPEWEIVGYLSNPDGTDQKKEIIGISHWNWNFAVLHDYPIHSVKRLSDNVIWSLDDKFTATAGCSLTIKKFEIAGDSIKVWSKEYGYWFLDDIKKILLAKEGKVIVSTAALYKFLSEKMEFWKDEVKIYGTGDELIIDGFKGLMVHCQKPFECTIEIGRMRQLKRLLGAISDQPITLIIDGFKFEIQHITI